MTKLRYTPDRDLKVHEQGAIRLICASFQSHEAGLPELLKNAADEYARHNFPEEQRVIVLILSQGGRGSVPSISVLDFSGMSSRVIEEHFRIWADPEAATRGLRHSGVQGGHGNGGKCYMTQMFDDHALIRTVKGGKRNCYGVVSGSVVFGYTPDRASGRDFPVRDIRSELEAALRITGCALLALPKQALAALDRGDGFTLVTGVGPKGYETRIPTHHLISSLQEHPQMIRTIELCSVFTIVNGHLFDAGKALALADIPPLEGGEVPRDIAIPSKLKDPVSEVEVSTTEGGKLPRGQLVLRTSKVSMRWTKKQRHNVIYKAQSGYIGYVPVDALDIQSPYRDRIYGDCSLESLEPFKQNDRSRLAASPMTRAVERFVGEQIEKYAREFESKERRRVDRQEKDAVSKMNEALDKWKNRFLNRLMRGQWGSIDGLGTPLTPPLPTGKPARLELVLTRPRAGVGVSFRPSIKFFDADGRRIQAVPIEWIGDDTNVAMVDPDLTIVTTFAPGFTSLSAQTVKGKVASNRVPLEVVKIRNIEIAPRSLELAVGGRQKLEAVCKLDDGTFTSDLYLVWTEANASIASVSAAGFVFGHAMGETDVVAGDDRCLSRDPAKVKVVPGDGRGRGGRHGRGFPRVLVSGEVDPDPDAAEYVHFSNEDPPVAQRPQDVERNIWWINSAAPLARLYLDTGSGYGYRSREWRIYHLERFIDVIVQVALINSPEEDAQMSVNEWILRWGSKASQIQAAAVSDLSDFIKLGNLPGE